MPIVQKCPHCWQSSNIVTCTKSNSCWFCKCLHLSKFVKASHPIVKKFASLAAKHITSKFFGLFIPKVAFHLSVLIDPTSQFLNGTHELTDWLWPEWPCSGGGAYLNTRYMLHYSSHVYTLTMLSVYVFAHPQRSILPILRFGFFAMMFGWRAITSVSLLLSPHSVVFFV